MVSTDNEKLICFAITVKSWRGTFPVPPPPPPPPPRLSFDSNTSPTTRHANVWPEVQYYPYKLVRTPPPSAPGSIPAYMISIPAPIRNKCPSKIQCVCIKVPVYCVFVGTEKYSGSESATCTFGRLFLFLQSIHVGLSL